MAPRPCPSVPQEGRRRRWSWRVYLATAGTDSKATFIRAGLCQGWRGRLQPPPPEEAPLPCVRPLPERPRTSWGGLRSGRAWGAPSAPSGTLGGRCWEPGLERFPCRQRVEQGQASPRAAGAQRRHHDRPAPVCTIASPERFGPALSLQPSPSRWLNLPRDVGNLPGERFAVSPGATALSEVGEHEAEAGWGQPAAGTGREGR